MPRDHDEWMHEFFLIACMNWDDGEMYSLAQEAMPMDPFFPSAPTKDEIEELYEQCIVDGLDSILDKIRKIG